MHTIIVSKSSQPSEEVLSITFAFVFFRTLSLVPESWVSIRDILFLTNGATDTSGPEELITSITISNSCLEMANGIIFIVAINWPGSTLS